MVARKTKVTKAQEADCGLDIAGVWIRYALRLGPENWIFENKDALEKMLKTIKHLRGKLRKK